MDLHLFLHNGLAAHLYYSEESLVDGVVRVNNLCLVFPGLPSFIEKEYFECRVAKDTAFLVFYYYGTWLSGGEFSPESARKTIADAVVLATEKKAISTFNNMEVTWDYEALFVMGYSFAGNPVLTSLLDRKTVAAVLLYAPLIYVNRDDVERVLGLDTEKFIVYNQEFLGFIRRGYPNVLRGIEQPEWISYFNGVESLSRITLSPEYPPIRIFHGTKDHQIDPLFSKFFQQEFASMVDLEMVEGYGHTKELFKTSHLTK